MAARSPQTLAVAFPSYQLRPLTGETGLALARAVWSGEARPVRVSRVLELMFEQISGQPVTPDRVKHLVSSGREWLLQQAALRFWPDNGWFQARCSTCEKDFDLPVTLAQAPRKPAAEGFPMIELDTTLGRRAFEAPNGVHEERLAIEPGSDPTRRLLALCGLEQSAVDDAMAFTSDDLAHIESVFEEVCPDVADSVVTQCPDCHADIVARIDPLQFAFPRAQTLLREVHTIAGTYHWSEAEILALPASRREIYAELIRADRSGGQRR